jgi:hypothetical protein
VGEFEVFRRDMPVGGRDPVVTIRRGGGIVLNRAAFESLGSPEAVELMFDVQDRVMGIRAGSSDSKDAFPVRLARNQRSFAISGRTFIQYYDILSDQVRHLPAAMDGSILCVEVGAAPKRG